MNTPKPLSYTIKRIGENSTENIEADSLNTAGDPPSFHFSLNGRDVSEIFVHALEREPTPNYPQTPEEREAWRKAATAMNSAIAPRRLQR